MNTKKVYHVLATDEYGQTVPLGKVQHESYEKAEAWAQKNINFDRYGYLIRTVKVLDDEVKETEVKETE